LQEVLFPSEAALPFEVADARISAELYRSAPRARAAKWISPSRPARSAGSRTLDAEPRGTSPTSRDSGWRVRKALCKIELFVVKQRIALDQHGAAEDFLQFLQILVLVGFEHLGDIGCVRSTTSLPSTLEAILRASVRISLTTVVTLLI